MVDVPGVSKEPLNPMVVSFSPFLERKKRLTMVIREGDVKSGRERLWKF